MEMVSTNCETKQKNEDACFNLRTTDNHPASTGGTNSKLGDNAHSGAARGSMNGSSCVDRSRLLRVCLVRVGFPSRQIGWPLPEEEAGDFLVGLGDSLSGGSSADFHDRSVAFEPQFEGSGASFGFCEHGFSDCVSVNGEHRGALGALCFHLSHEPGVSDGVVLFFGASMVRSALGWSQ